MKEEYGEKLGERIKMLRKDNGGEYKNDPFLKLCCDESIERHFTVREIPQQNRVAERMNRTLLEKFCCMLSNADISKSFWVEDWRILAISLTGCFRLQ